MTVTIATGPPWLSLDSTGRLTGTPPAAGAYPVTLQSTVGLDTATLAVSVIVTALNTVPAIVTTTQLELSRIVISFSAFVAAQLLVRSNLAISFSATAGQLVPIVMPDNNEVNDQSFQATLLTNGQASTNTLHKADQYDWFKFTTTTAGSISFTLSGFARPASEPATVLGIDIDLIDSQLNFVWSSSLSTASPAVTSPSQPAGQYYVRVRNPVANSSITSYTLTVTW